MARSSTVLAAFLGIVAIGVCVGFYLTSTNFASVKTSLASLTSQVNTIATSLKTSSTGDVVLSSTDASATITPVIKPTVTADTATLSTGTVRLFAGQTLKEYRVVFTYAATNTSSVWEAINVDFLSANGFDNTKMVTWEASAYIPRQSSDTLTGNMQAYSHDVITTGASSASAVTYKFLTVGYPGKYTVNLRILCKA
jgi:hypothetical protein